MVHRGAALSSCRIRPLPTNANATATDDDLSKRAGCFLGEPMTKWIWSLAVAAPSVIAAGALALVVAAIAPAHAAKHARSSGRAFLHRALEVAQTGDLTDTRLLGKKLGLRFALEQMRHHRYAGGTCPPGTRNGVRLRGYERRFYDLAHWDYWYICLPRPRKSFTVVYFQIGMAAPGFCVTAADFRSVFGPKVRRFDATDSGGTTYEYILHVGSNEISVHGDFKNERCMQILGLDQNRYR